MLGEVTDVRYSPKGGCTDLICDCIAASHGEILVMAYEFTSARISEALIAAIERGLPVHLVQDKLASATKSAEWPALLKAGGKVWIDGKHRIMHDKVMMIDGSTIITGSFNFTVPAEDDHAENLVVIEGHDLCDMYVANFTMHLLHSVPATPAHAQAHAAALSILPEKPLDPDQVDAAPLRMKALLGMF